MASQHAICQHEALYSRNMAPTMCAPGIDGLVLDFNVSSQTVSTLTIILHVLGLAIGYMLISPLSEFYGRLQCTRLPA